LLVYDSIFSVSPGVTYSKYVPPGEPWIRSHIRHNPSISIYSRCLMAWLHWIY